MKPGECVVLEETDDTPRWGNQGTFNEGSILKDVGRVKRNQLRMGKPPYPYHCREPVTSLEAERGGRGKDWFPKPRQKC